MLHRHAGDSPKFRAVFRDHTPAIGFQLDAVTIKMIVDDPRKVDVPKRDQGRDISPEDLLGVHVPALTVSGSAESVVWREQSVSLKWNRRLESEQIHGSRS